MNVYIDSGWSDDRLREEIYRGSVFLHSARPSVLRLCQLAQQLIERAFAPLDPATVHEHMSAEQCAAMLSKLKPEFIHHPQAKECLQAVLLDFGCDPDKTFFDVPRLRTAFPGEYLKSGIAYAFHPHRDTWYSAPSCQINWWLPVYEISAANCMAIHPHYFDRAIKNGSATYNYHRWNRDSRLQAGQHVKQDTRVQPHAEEPLELQPEIRLVPSVGGAYQFSAAQLHSTAPNETTRIRYSIDFRTVHLDDALARRGAPNVDAACTGTTMGDYLRLRDLQHLPAEVMEMYQDGSEREYAQSELALKGER